MFTCQPSFRWVTTLITTIQKWVCKPPTRYAIVFFIFGDQTSAGVQTQTCHRFVELHHSRRGHCQYLSQHQELRTALIEKVFETGLEVAVIPMIHRLLFPPTKQNTMNFMKHMNLYETACSSTRPAHGFVKCSASRRKHPHRDGPIIDWDLILAKLGDCNSGSNTPFARVVSTCFNQKAQTRHNFWNWSGLSTFFQRYHFRFSYDIFSGF